MRTRSLVSAAVLGLGTCKEIPVAVRGVPGGVLSSSGRNLQGNNFSLSRADWRYQWFGD